MIVAGSSEPRFRASQVWVAVGLQQALRRDGRRAELKKVTFTDCCGLRLLVIDFHLSGGDLTMRYCERCESRRWLRGEHPVKFSVIKECVGAMQPATGPRAGTGRQETACARA
jgi:hypothetical protein